MAERKQFYPFGNTYGGGFLDWYEWCHVNVPEVHAMNVATARRLFEAINSLAYTAWAAGANGQSWEDTGYSGKEGEE